MPHPSETFVSDNQVPNVYYCTRTDKVTGAVVTRGPYTGNLMGYKSAFSRAASTNNPPNSFGWRKPAAYNASFSEETIEGAPMTVTTSGSSTTTSIVLLTNPFGVSVNTHLGSTNDINILKNRALGRFASKSIDLGTAFIERRQTANMVSKAFVDVAKIARKIRRGQVGAFSSKKAIDEFFNRWLEYRYGWQPLLGDVFGACQAVEKADNGTFDRYWVTSRARMRLSQDYPIYAENLVHGSNLTGCSKGRIVRSGLQTIDTELKVRYDAIITNATYLRLTDVGLTNPALTAWELVPYSFVVDWALGVGDWLTSVNALKGYQFMGGCLTKYTRWSREAVALGWDVPTLQTDYACAYSANGRFFDRSVLTSSGGGITVKKNPVNPKRLMDSIALLKQAFGRSR